MSFYMLGYFNLLKEDKEALILPAGSRHLAPYLRLDRILDLYNTRAPRL